MASISGVYAIVCKLNNKLYVGSSVDIRGRWNQHKSMLTGGTHHSPHLQNSWNKYGKDLFDWVVLEECLAEECVTREQLWLDKLESYRRENGYNVSSVAASRKGVPSPEVAESNRRRIWTETAKQDMSIKSSGPKSSVTRERMSWSRIRYWQDPSKKLLASQRTREQWERRKLKPTESMSISEFGRKLLDLGDLDPVYTCLWGAELDQEELHNWLIAYFAFYHVGTASWIADAYDVTDYWCRFRAAAASSNWPRSSERRHFRGRAAAESTAYLEGRGVYDLFSELIGDGTEVGAAEVIASVKGWVGFGPWVAFKVADMLERLAIRPVRFDLGTAMYKGSPTDAAELLWDREHGPAEWTPRERTKWAAEYVLSSFPQDKAPPRFERPLGLQEAETILCKWKSYLGGHYHVGEDVKAVRLGLARFGRCRIAQRLYAGGKQGGLWGR